MEEIRKERLKTDHLRLVKLGFTKVYSDDKSISWYEMDILNAKPFPEAKLIYEYEDDYNDVVYMSLLVNPLGDVWEEITLAEGGLSPTGLLPIMYQYNLLNEYGEKEFNSFMEED